MKVEISFDEDTLDFVNMVADVRKIDPSAYVRYLVYTYGVEDLGDICVDCGDEIRECEHCGKEIEDCVESGKDTLRRLNES